MQAAAAVFSKAFSTISGALGVGGAAAPATGAGIASTAVGVGSSLLAISYQRSVLARQAAMEEENARRARAAGAIEAQEADFEAAAVASEVLARQGASGLNVRSRAFYRRRTRNAIRATTNRQRIVNDAEVQARNAEERASGARAESRGLGMQALFTGVSGAFDLGTDLISGANLNRRLARQRNQTSVRRV